MHTNTHANTDTHKHIHTRTHYTLIYTTLLYVYVSILVASMKVIYIDMYIHVCMYCICIYMHTGITQISTHTQAQYPPICHYNIIKSTVGYICSQIKFITQLKKLLFVQTCTCSYHYYYYMASYVMDKDMTISLITVSD